MKTEIIKLLTEKSKENAAFYNLLIILLKNEKHTIKKEKQKDENIPKDEDISDEPTKDELDELQRLGDELLSDGE